MFLPGVIKEIATTQWTRMHYSLFPFCIKPTTENIVTDTHLNYIFKQDLYFTSLAIKLLTRVQSFFKLQLLPRHYELVSFKTLPPIWHTHF